MKQRRSDYSYKPSPIKEAAREVLDIQTQIGRIKRALKDLSIQEKEAMDKLAFLLSSTKSKTTEVDFVQFKLTEDGKLIQSLKLKS